MVLKVHITGGKGFLGKYVVDALAGDAFEVEVSDVDTLDVTDADAVVARLQADKPDVVCHLAGLTGANASLEAPQRFFEVNCAGTWNVLEACRRAEVRGFVFLSSLTVHGQSSVPVDEDSPMRPRHPYAGSKAAAELAVRTYAQCFGLNAAILRATLIAGEGQAEANAISEFVETTLRGETVEIYGDGAHRREWLHPADLASAVHAAVDKVAGVSEPMCETYIVSPGESISMAELAAKVIAHTGKGDVSHRPSTRQAFDLCTSAGKVREQLGWTPAVPIDEIVRRVTAVAEARVEGVADE